jgi:hypothetical protein
LRQVDIASSTDQENRRLTMLRKEAGQARTRLVNKIRHILCRHNLHGGDLQTGITPVI